MPPTCLPVSYGCIKADFKPLDVQFVKCSTVQSAHARTHARTVPQCNNVPTAHVPHSYELCHGVQAVPALEQTICYCLLLIRNTNLVTDISRDY